jgi:hypothetical protein
MKTMMHPLRALADDPYQVSATDLADKILERIWPKSDSFQWMAPSIRLIATAPVMKTPSRKKLN